jgi:hypothetical protein
MIRDIADRQSIEFDRDTLKKLLDRAETVSSNRDLVTHGIWLHTNKGWSVQRTSGTWPKQPVVLNGPSGSRRIMPEGVDMDETKLRSIWTDIESLIVLAKKLQMSGKIAPDPSPETHP